jgi:hypothetical protein
MLICVMFCYLCVMLCYVCLLENKVCCAHLCATFTSLSKILENSILDTGLTCNSIHVFGINNNNITEILKYVTWDREVYPIQQGIPKSHLPEMLPRSNPDALYCKLAFHRVHKCVQAYVVTKGPP